MDAVMEDTERVCVSEEDVINEMEADDSLLGCLLV